MLLSSSISHKPGDEIGRFGIRLSPLCLHTDQLFQVHRAHFNSVPIWQIRRMTALPLPKAIDLPSCGWPKALSTAGEISSLTILPPGTLVAVGHHSGSASLRTDHSWLDGAFQRLQRSSCCLRRMFGDLLITDERPGESLRGYRGRTTKYSQDPPRGKRPPDHLARLLSKCLEQPDASALRRTSQIRAVHRFP